MRKDLDGVVEKACEEVDRMLDTAFFEAKKHFMMGMKQNNFAGGVGCNAGFNGPGDSRFVVSITYEPPKFPIETNKETQPSQTVH